MVFVKTYDLLSGALAFTSFKLDVMRNDWVTNVAPYFEPALETQVIE